MIVMLANAFRTYGVGAGLLYIVGQAIKRVGLKTRLRVYEILIQPVSADTIGPAKKMDSFEIRQVEPGSDLLSEFPRSKELIQHRYDQGGICLAALKSERLIGYQWLTLGPYEEDEVRCRFAPEPPRDSAFDYDIYIFPQYRIGLGFLALWNASNQLLSGDGISYTCSRVSRFNTQSRKSHRHFGCRRAGIAVFLSGPKRQLMFASTAPYFHLSLRKSSRPTITIDTRRFAKLAELRA